MSDVTILGGDPMGATFGNAGNALLIDPQRQALRQSPSPLDYLTGGRVLGHYRAGAQSGATTVLAAGALLFGLRNPDPNILVALMRLRVSMAITVAFAVGQPLDIAMTRVTKWISPDTGGTAMPPIPSRTTMGNSILNAAAGSLVIAPAAGLTAGATKTPDAGAYQEGNLFAGVATTLSGTLPLTLYDAHLEAGGHPLILASQEGINLSNVTVQGATGVVRYYVDLEWAELAGF